MHALNFNQYHSSIILRRAIIAVGKQLIILWLG